MADVSDRIIQAVIGVVIVASVLAGTAATVLAQFTNLTGAGFVLTVLFATILPLLFAVFAYRAVKRQLDMIK